MRSPHSAVTGDAARVDEAERWLDAELRGRPIPPLVIAIGLGQGHLLDALDRRGHATRVVALEPDPVVAARCLARQAPQAWRTTGRLAYCVDPDYAGADDAWRLFPAEPNDHVILVDPGVARQGGPAAVRAARVLKRIVFGARANAEARRRFAPRYLLNTLRNVPTAAASADVAALTNAFRGVAAVVVAAGPSLDRNLVALRETAGRALIIAVDTAARPLLEAGIAPHLVAAVDPGEANARHLADLDVPETTWLVAEASLDPSALAPFGSRLFTFTVADHHPWPWLRAAGLTRGRLRAWGSVLTSAFDIAVRAGCDPVIFAGTDLAFTGDRPYCRGTTYEQDWAARVAAGESLDGIWRSSIEASQIVHMPDIAGLPALSSAPLVAFRDWLVEQTRQDAARRFVNATGAGVLVGDRIEQTRLEDVLSASAVSPRGLEAEVASTWSRGRQNRVADAALRAAMASLVDCRDDREPMASWLAFTGGAMDATAIHAGVRDTLDHWTSPIERMQAERPPASAVRYPPERALMVRGAVAGEPRAAGLSAQSIVSSPARAAAQTRAWDALTVLVGAPRLLDPDATVGAIAPGTSATRAFPWTSRTLPLARELEAALADLLVSEGEVESAVERADAIARLDEEPIGVGREEVSRSAEDAADMRARLALLADWLDVRAALDGAVAASESASDRLPLRVGARLARVYAGAVNPGVDQAKGEASAAIGIGGARHVAPVPARPSADALGDALTGQLVWSPGPSTIDAGARWPALSIRGADGSASLVVTYVDAGSERSPRSGVPTGARRDAERPGWVEPRRLTGPDLPTCLVGNLLDHSHALFAIVGGDCAVRVDAAGRVERDAAWPCAISGQVRWGDAGAIAWHNDSQSYVMWREHPQGDVQTAEIPFVASLAFPQETGEIWWTGFSGGLWSWTPGGDWRRRADTPSVLGLQTTGDGVLLAPSGGDIRFVDRTSPTEAFLWRPGSNRVEAVPLGPEGPCWSVSARGAWRALAYPYRDVVMLEHQSGLQVQLTCRYPFNLAWAGPALVVSTGAGDLLLFPDLATTLERGRTVRS
jgi:hypothetical protein